MPSTITRAMRRDEATARGWTERRCPDCLGTGQRPGTDHRCIINQCPACEGNGTYWLSPQGRKYVRPGGRFLKGR
jgi:DnaJ-class molecular chaperone